jgi:DNA-binding winged helix-turn-helix (wHTH) protein
VRIRFADCVLDTAVRELRRAGQVVPLSPKAFRLLEVLAERRPRAVSQEELRSFVWPETVAGGTTLARLISDVRVALGDRARGPRFIRTVQRFGYAFCCDAVEDRSDVAPGVAYALQWGTEHVALAIGEHTIGRAPDVLVSLRSSRVSRRHACVRVAESGVTIEDLGSKNGTRVGEQPIDGPVALHDGDRVTIGPVLLIFRALRVDPTTSTQVSAG